jgi:LysM repeat protein
MTDPIRAEDVADHRPGAVHAESAATGLILRHHPSAREAVSGTCPYLTSSGGSFRSANPSRDHRCGAMDPPTPQPTDKQRKHCLSPDHVDCPTFRAARAARTATLAGGSDPALVEAADLRRRPLARTAPILLEPQGLVDQAVRLRLDRAPGQIALIGLMVLAFAVVALTRLSAGGSPPAPPSSEPSSVPLISPSPAPTPSPTPSLEASAPPSANPSPSFRTTYKVKKGDTLLAIAKRYGTTAARIRTLNGMKNSTLKIGQILKIP